MTQRAISGVAIPTTHQPPVMDGVSRCTRYAFGPNKLHLCGPDANNEVLAYISEGVTDSGLTNILTGFKTLYPYLEQIAQANHIKDIFDDRVVEAYWLGSELLDTIPAKTFYRHLTDNLQIHKQSSTKQIDQLKDKLTQGALMHHAFHVLNIWRRTGHNDVEHTTNTFDKCCVTWGKVLKVVGPTLTVSRQPIILKDGKLHLGSAQQQKIARRLEASTLLDTVKVGDTITIHWDTPCEIINDRQLTNLRKYTTLSLRLANQTI